MRTVLRIAALPFVLAAVAAGLCYAAAGATLGFYFGSIALVSLILPAMAAGQDDRARTLIAGAAVVDGVGIVWLAAALGGATSLGQWLACYVALAAYALALCGLARGLNRMFGWIAAAAGVVVAAIAWLTWPVWMSAEWSASAAGWLTPAQPLFAVNHVLLDLGVWTQQRLMYQYTALGQDVPYALPRSIWPCVLLHAFVGAMALWWSQPARRAPSSGSSSGSPALSSTSASAAGA